MTNKQALLEALKEAEAPSRELDLSIAVSVVGMVIEKRGRDRNEWLYDDTAPNFPKRFSINSWGNHPRYTASLDACLALQEMLLPGDLTIRETRHRGEFDCEIDTYEGQEIAAAYDAPTRPLALLIAIVEALIAQEQETE